MTRFTVPGNPVVWRRPQHQGKRYYEPTEIARAKQWIQMHARKAKARPLEGPVRLELAFYRDSAQACDIDNLTKLVQDALNGIAYGDDRQIVVLSALKAVDAKRPRTEVIVSKASSVASVSSDMLDDIAQGVGREPSPETNLKRFSEA